MYDLTSKQYFNLRKYMYFAIGITFYKLLC